MILHWPQILMLIFMAIKTFNYIERDIDRGSWPGFAATVIVIGTFNAVLYFGGFWTGGK